LSVEALAIVVQADWQLADEAFGKVAAGSHLGSPQWSCYSRGVRGVSRTTVSYRQPVICWKTYSKQLFKNQNELNQKMMNLQILDPVDATVALLALMIEALVGYPDWVTHAIGHPVIWIGNLIAALDHTLNHVAWGWFWRRAVGALAVLVLIIAAGEAGLMIEQSLLLLPFAPVTMALAASALLAQRSLYDHVARVALALEAQGLAAARKAVARIVGRDPESLDESGVARAAIESLAENFSDAVVAPAVWLAIAGLAGAAIYKAVNTADSMIGHRTARYEAFGFTAARLDDLLNVPAARLAGLLIVAAAALTPGASAAAAVRAMWNDAARHRSPNAGYPEAAMAGALGLALGGRRTYPDAGIVEDALMGHGRGELTAADVRAALALYKRADGLFIGLAAALVLGLALRA
jgi:adenosylcobinamide-phosphate synthase